MLIPTQYSEQLDEHFKISLEEFVSNPSLNNSKSFITKNNPFVRPMRPQDLNIDLLNTPLKINNLTDNSYLQIHRILTTIYEQDLIFLPTNGINFEIENYMKFYDRDLYRKGEYVRSRLEDYVFSFLDEEISVSGIWDIQRFKQYTDNVFNQMKESESNLYNTLVNSNNPESAAKFFLIQCAGDFLSEASAMARNVLGNYGDLTSELFKVLIDEYGYGVHHKKHSTIFEKLLDELDMDKSIHAYWQFYTASSLALINYCHYISKNHRYFFRYLGALYFTEASLAFVTKDQSRALRKIFGENINTQYFDEHSHIDVHHGRMALEKLIIPAVEKYGEQILPEILTGFEQFRLLQDLADEEFARHIQYHDNLHEYVSKGKEAIKFIKDQKPDMKFIENKNELSITHMHSVNELFSVVAGCAKLILSPYQEIILNEGETIFLPKGILHGSIIQSESCEYTVTQYKGD